MRSASGEPVPTAAVAGPRPAPERHSPARFSAGRAETRPGSLDPLILALGQAVRRMSEAGRVRDGRADGQD